MTWIPRLVGFFLLVAAAPAQASTILTSGWLREFRQMDMGGYYVSSWQLHMEGNGLSVHLSQGSEILIESSSVYCGVAGQPCSYTFASSFATSLPVSGATVTVGGVTYTNAIVRLSGTIASMPQTAITTCNPCPSPFNTNARTYSIVWPDFPFTLSGSIAVYLPDGPGGHWETLVANENFNGSGVALASQDDIRYGGGGGSEVYQRNLTFTPEPSTLAMLAASLIFGALCAARRRTASYRP
jgi:hypothetical protein